MAKKAVLFDLDGTLWDSTAETTRAWNQTFAKCSDLPGFEMTVQTMAGLMGKTTAEIAACLLPQLPLSRAVEVIQLCCAEENAQLLRHGGKLYPGVQELFVQLAQLGGVYIVSNCETGYIEAFLQYYRTLQPLVDGFLCAGETGRPKGENITALCARHHIDSAIYVGDTQSDLDAALFAGLPFIHAAYGFGTVDRPVPTARTPLDILPLAERLLAQ
ncbi:HAD family hydrolase [Neobittarella massiliensis]|uniref:HAD family hydrolase n=1 Tax=Neobittarella massiliensis (ex Bilen et al. 2018) TaxID=2041842 RepID=UPI000CF663A6|nr:HAD family hydrolase [Neobittarella massiliensis]